MTSGRLEHRFAEVGLIIDYVVDVHRSHRGALRRMIIFPACELPHAVRVMNDQTNWAIRGYDVVTGQD